MNATRVPYDPAGEAEAVGSLLGGWIAALPPEILYDERYERLRVAASTITGRHYEVRDGRALLVLDGLDLDCDDRSLAEALATAAPVATSADIARLVDLASRRRALVALLDATNAITSGADIREALTRLSDAA